MGMPEFTPKAEERLAMPKSIPPRGGCPENINPTPGPDFPFYSPRFVVTWRVHTFGLCLSFAVHGRSLMVATTIGVALSRRLLAQRASHGTS
jgi:hypothetical protein